MPHHAAALPPLAGLLVLDLTRVLAGPWCTMTLADLGAEVIKIENPKGGDDTRAWSPPEAGGESAYYLCANRNKKSVAVDLGHAEGRRLVRALAAKADVLVENFRAGALARFGLDYPALAAENPGLVYCSISGYGRESPKAELGGYDFVVQAEGGLMAITGEADGAPMKLGVAIADLIAGMNATGAILAALTARARDGKGQFIDIALLDGVVAALANVASNHLVSGRPARRYGNAHANVVPYQLFEASDGALVLACGNDRQFAVLCGEVLGRAELAADPRFATNRARAENREALVPVLAALFAARPRAHWLAALRAAGVPAGAIREVAEVLAAPEVLARGMVQEVPHPTAGAVRLVASPLKLARTPVREIAPPPLLGEHTDEVLGRRLGLSAAEIARLREARAIA
ncbi:MAG: CoA transferase [Proteobacteria bacterium]|nr:CoA transferase [Pseudomonadota bacterium]